MYDLAIIGAGIAGIACAKYSKKFNLKTILLEENEENFGGVCLNKGCIPTKFFLNSSKSLKSWDNVFLEKEELVKKIKNPLIKQFKDLGIEINWGKVSFLDEHTLKVKDSKIQAKNIIIATGSLPKAFFQHKNLVFPEDLFNKKKIGKNILIVGGGYTGIELASLLNNFGKNVIIVEKEKNILSNFSESLTFRLRNILEKKGIKIYTDSLFSKFDLDSFDLIISAVGRIPNFKELGIEKVGLLTTKEGWLCTDNFLRTNIEHIYACGDITGKFLLAYTAEYQAQICIDNILGKNISEDYSVVPLCVFSFPQIARVGFSEEELKAKGINYKIVKSNFLKFSSAYVYDDKDGFLQVFLDKKDRIIGAEVISNFACELINNFSLAIKNNLNIYDFKKTLFIHPTISEIIGLIFKV